MLFRNAHNCLLLDTVSCWKTWIFMNTAMRISQDRSYFPLLPSPFHKSACDVSRLYVLFVPFSSARTPELMADSLYHLRQLLEKHIYSNRLRLLRALYITDFFGARNWVLIAVWSFCGPVSRAKYYAVITPANDTMKYMCKIRGGKFW
jgi:hypothetical protein